MLYKRVAVGFILVIHLATLAGCGTISGDVHGYISYNESDDSFMALTVIENITVANNDAKKHGIHQDYLVSLFKNRQDIICFPEINILERKIYSTAFLYVDLEHYRHINLSEKQKAGDLYKSPFFLNRILVQPGNFYSGNNGSLCYSHIIGIAGKDLDLLIANELKSANDDFAGQNKRMMTARETPLTETNRIEGRYYWDDFPTNETLEFWIDQPTDILHLHRDMNYLIASIQMTEADSLTFLDYLGKRLTEYEGDADNISNKLEEYSKMEQGPYTRGISEVEMHRLLEEKQQLFSSVFRLIYDSITIQPTPRLGIVRLSARINLLSAYNLDVHGKILRRLDNLTISSEDIKNSADTIQQLRTAGISVHNDIRTDAIVEKFFDH